MYITILLPYFFLLFLQGENKHDPILNDSYIVTVYDSITDCYIPNSSNTDCHIVRSIFFIIDRSLKSLFLHLVYTTRHCTCFSFEREKKIVQ